MVQAEAYLLTNQLKKGVITFLKLATSCHVCIALVLINNQNIRLNCSANVVVLHKNLKSCMKSRSMAPCTMISDVLLNYV